MSIKAQKKEKTKSKTEVKKSYAGLGLFATDTFKKDEDIIEYTGERISAEEANKRGGKYLFEVTEKITIDGKGREHKARYINHCCAPNAEAINRKNRIFIVAKKEIKKGEEITYHYGKEYFDEYIKKGFCKCPKCRA